MKSEQKDELKKGLDYMGYMQSVESNSSNQPISSNTSKGWLLPIVLFLIGLSVITFLVQNILIILLVVIFIGFMWYLFTK